MYPQFIQTQTQQAITDILSKTPEMSVAGICEALNLSEAEATFCLPSHEVTAIDLAQKTPIMQQLPTLGSVTTIIKHAESVFEFKGAFPQGNESYGYYNLQAEGDRGFCGHLRLDLVSAIALVSRPLRGRESHYLGFYRDNGDCMFKVYTGREVDFRPIASQVSQFQDFAQQQAS